MRLAGRVTSRVALVLVVTSLCMLLVYHQASNVQEESLQTLSQEQQHQMVREAESEMDERRRLVERVCTKYNLGLYRSSVEPSIFKHPPTPQYSVFYIDRTHKMTWCPVYKAASSTWLHQLLLLAGHSEEFLRTTKRQLSEIGRLAYPVPDNEVAEEAFKATLKLLIVRHPFERLLSAYRDKLENKNIGLEHGVLHFYQSYGRKIVQKFRNSTSKKPEPTFREFVSYLLKEDVVRYDDHWLPFYLYCTPCLVRYDIIAHVETMFRDQLYTIRAANLDGLIEPRWRHLTKGQRSAGETAKKYFAELSRWQVKKLFEIYKLDFELFGYKPDEYILYASEL